MRTALILLAILLMFPANFIFAAETTPTFVEIHTNNESRKKLIRDNLPLTDTEAAAFWPRYDAFINKISTFSQHRSTELEKLGESFDTMTDDLARQATHENLQLQNDRLNIMVRYFKELESILPSKKLLRYYQLEYHIRSVVDAKINESIPLVQ